MLGRVSVLSLAESLREEVMSLPLSTIPSLHMVHKPLLIYGRWVDTMFYYILFYLLSTQYLSRYSELKRSCRDFRWYYTGNWTFSSSVSGIVQLKLWRLLLIIIHRKHWTILKSPPTNEAHRIRHVSLFRNTNAVFFDTLTICRFFPEFP